MSEDQKVQDINQEKQIQQEESGVEQEQRQNEIQTQTQKNNIKDQSQQKQQQQQLQKSKQKKSGKQEEEEFYLNESLNNNKSLWIAKKMRSETEKNIDVLSNRIQLLKNEEERTLKRISDTRTKTQNVLQAKNRNEINSSQKNNNKKQDDEFLQMMQQRSYKLRRQQEEEREAIRHALYELKREETNEIKRQSQINKKKISDARRKSMDEKNMNAQKVQSIKEQSKQNIELYWQERLRFFEKQQDQTRFEHIKTKHQKDTILSKLEQEEQELIRRLQMSQEIHENACKELEKVIQLPANQYLKEKEADQSYAAEQNFSNTKQQQQQQQQQNINNNTESKITMEDKAV